MRSFALIPAALAACVVAAPAAANLTAVGEPVDGGSWRQEWHQHDVAGDWFDTIAIKIFSDGDSFVPDYVTSLSDSSWSTVFMDDEMVILAGNATTSLHLTLHHNGTKNSEGTVFEAVWATFSEGVLVEEFDTTRGIPGQAYSLGSGWRGDYNTQWTDPAADVNGALSAVPAPGAAMLVFVGMGLVGWARRRVA